MDTALATDGCVGPRKSLQIALDYDRTFTEDKVLWRSFVSACGVRGHKVTIVTFREAEDVIGNRDIEADAKAMGVPIIYTAGGQKAEYFKADIWIDDMPFLIPTRDQMLIGSLSFGQ